MLRILLLSAALILPAAAQEGRLPEAVTRTADQLMRTGLEDGTGYAVIEDLTTEVGARLAGSPSEARARQWAKARLEEMGFSNVRIEPFTLPFWSRAYEDARASS